MDELCMKRFFIHKNLRIAQIQGLQLLGGIIQSEDSQLLGSEKKYIDRKVLHG